MIAVLDEPLVERRIYRFLMYLGLIALLGTIMIYLIELVIYPPFIQVMLTEGMLPSLSYNSQLNLIHSFDSLILISIGLGFFGIFAKYGKKSGYVFLLLFVFPIFSLQPSIAGFVIGITGIDNFLIWYLSAWGPAIGQSLVLAILLYHSLEPVIGRRITGLVSLTLATSQISQVVWYFSTRHLAPVYDFVNWTVEGSIANTLLVCIPIIIGAITCVIIFVAFFVITIRKEWKSIDTIHQTKEVMDNIPKEIVISS